MKIMHRISFNNKNAVKNELERKGFIIKSGPITSFEISEDDLRWPLLREIIIKYGNSNIMDWQYGTKFSKSEISNSKFFQVLPKWHFSYPQPENNFEYRNITYQNSKICNKCGIGYEQTNPFYLKGNPKWNNKNITQLNWVFDELFVSKELKTNLSKYADINFLNVYKYPSGEILDNIYQVLIQKVVPIKINATSIVCDCGKYKYKPHTRGFFPFPIVTDFSIAKTDCYFGDAHSAFREILISKKMYDLFKQLGVTGITYVPCGEN